MYNNIQLAEASRYHLLLHLLTEVRRIQELAVPPGGREKDTVMQEKPLLTFDDLTAVAADLNQASNDLTQIVTTLDSALKRLNLGIVVWVEISRNHDEKFPAQFECEQVGYAKTNGNWGLVIRKLFGNVSSLEQAQAKVRDIWLFNDAPRGVRLRAVEKLPEVIDQLARSAMKTAERVKKKVAETRGFASSIGVSQADEARGKN